jgi:hypothetical protein
MAYAESLDALLRSTAAQNIPFKPEKLGGEESAALDAVFGPTLARAIMDASYPGGLEAPVSAEELYLYPFAEIAQRQAGYRTGTPSPDWDDGRYVIADWAANPVSIGSDGAIAYSIHGRDHWDHRPIAPDFAVFLDMLARWIDYFIGTREGGIFVADFDLAPEVPAEVRKHVLRGLLEAEAENFADLLLGTV